MFLIYLFIFFRFFGSLFSGYFGNWFSRYFGSWFSGFWKLVSVFIFFFLGILEADFLGILETDFLGFGSYFFCVCLFFWELIFWVLEANFLGIFSEVLGFFFANFLGYWYHSSKNNFRSFWVWEISGLWVAWYNGGGILLIKKKQLQDLQFTLLKNMYWLYKKKLKKNITVLEHSEMDEDRRLNF